MSDEEEKKAPPEVVEPIAVQELEAPAFPFIVINHDLSGATVDWEYVERIAAALMERWGDEFQSNHLTPPEFTAMSLWLMKRELKLNA